MKRETEREKEQPVREERSKGWKKRTPDDETRSVRPHVDACVPARSRPLTPQERRLVA